MVKNGKYGRKEETAKREGEREKRETERDRDRKEEARRELHIFQSHFTRLYRLQSALV